jgi:hypothetical protein
MLAPVFAILFSIAGATWLDVPFIKQPKNDCGPASIWMVMQYWKAETPTVQAIHDATFSEPAAGVYAKDLEHYFADHNFQTWTFSGDWKSLRENLANGRPLIVVLRGTPLHFLVVAGMDDGRQIIFVNDPASRKLRAMHRQDFEDRWRIQNNWTLLALPKSANSEKPSDADSAPENNRSVDALEHASVAFRQNNYSEAKHYARAAEKIDPLNSTANDLLGTLYLLDNNVEAALKYWNRIKQPMIRDIQVVPDPAVDPVVLDRAFTFSRASTLSRNEYLATRRRLDATDLFSDCRFDFTPVDDTRFDLSLRALDRSGPHYIGWLRGLPYQTIQPQIVDIGRRTVNAGAFLRWDRYKRRATVTLEGPIAGTDALRFSGNLDYRNEDWLFHGTALSVRRTDAVLAMKSPVGAGGSVATGVTAGDSRIGYLGSVEYDLLRWPERRFVISGLARTAIARDHADRFAKIEPSVRINWLPQARGADFETSIQLRAGRATAKTPVDQLFILGLDRDTDLQLRAHSALSDGRRGAGPIGTRYALLNAQMSKIVHDFGIARLSGGPFIDTARMSSVFVDIGAFLDLSVGGSLKMSFSIGRDLRTGHMLGHFN